MRVYTINKYGKLREDKIATFFANHQIITGLIVIGIFILGCGIESLIWKEYSNVAWRPDMKPKIRFFKLLNI